MNYFKFHNKRLLFIILTSFFLSVQSSLFSSDSCTELKDILFKSYSEVILYITRNIETLKEKQQSCIDILVKNGKLEELDYYLNELAKKGVEYRENLSVSINTMKKALDEINNKHRFEKQEYQTVSPAFKWAQSLEDIFLEIKFAHRHDSPGCLEIKDMNVDIKNDSVKFEGYCVLGDVPIKIDFKLKKGEKSFWKKLLKDDTPIPPNMRVWFEMKEKYQEELKEFEEKEEKENDDVDKLLDKIDKKKEKKEKKRKKKMKGTNNNETNSENNNHKHTNKDNKVSKEDKDNKDSKANTNKTADL